MTTRTGLRRLRPCPTLGESAVTVVRAGEAPPDLPSDVSLLLVSAPTHEFSMPKPASRKWAVEKGATAKESAGVREWVEQVTYTRRWRRPGPDRHRRARQHRRYTSDATQVSQESSGCQVATCVAYSYEGAGNLTSRTSPNGVTSHTYDGLNRPITKTQAGGLVATATYDPPSI